MLVAGLVVLMVAVWLGGGVTEDGTSTDEILQLLAIPVLMLGLLALDSRPPRDRLLRCGLFAAGLVVVVPAIQLLPLLESAWEIAPARDALAADLARAGVGALHPHWTLGPEATERALWSMLPALAAFIAGIAVPAANRRHAVAAIVLLVFANTLFAIFQAGLPEESALRLYATAGFGGLLISANHQATALIIGMVLATSLAVDAWRRGQARGTLDLRTLGYAAAAAICLLAVPLSTSRAGVALALPALAATLFLCGGVSLVRLHRSRRVAVAAACLLALALAGTYIALGWMGIEEAEGLRPALSKAGIDIARAQSPWGGGMGNFVQLFEQQAPDALLLNTYVNHVHNEYVQWWLSGGWLALCALLAVSAVLVASGWRILRWREPGRDRAIAASAFVAICATLAHSWVDYPLRTTTLMTTTAMLAGLMLACLADASAGSRRPASRDGEGHGQPA